MNVISARYHRHWTQVLFLTALAAILLLSLTVHEGSEQAAKGKRRSSAPLAEVIGAAAPGTVRVPSLPDDFAPQTRLGFTVGDQWEPAIAADRFGHIYILYAQYFGVPGCPDCPNPTAIVQISEDRGSTWGEPRVISEIGQWDAQIVVDPVDGRTVYAAWLQESKSDIGVARSDDFGETWSVVVADSTNAGTDKPILAVRGQDVYVGYNHAQTVWVSSSHDGGQTFTSEKVNPNGKLGWSLAGGGTVDPAGNVYFGWVGYERNGNARGPANLYVSKSSDGGATWSNLVLDVSAGAPDCSEFLCGWAFLGAQLTLASDQAGTLYGLWNAGEVDGGPQQIFFAKSFDAGVTWTDRMEVSEAPEGANHAFPAIIAGAAGDVRIAWMDTREDPLWNTYYRSSTDGGDTWSEESDLSTFVAGFSYIFPDGFSFPFGDYFELDIDDRGDTHAIWGEGLTWDTPGSIWYTRGK